jgi:hypothetical protein
MGSDRRQSGELPSTPKPGTKFEEITADTLLGSHFVRTWPRSAGRPREVGTVRGTRGRELGIERGSWDRPPGPARIRSRGVPTDAGSWDHLARPRDPASEVRSLRGIERGKLGSTSRTGTPTAPRASRPTREIGIRVRELGSECPDRGMDQ